MNSPPGPFLVQIIPGNALVVDPTKQFKPLSKFGNTFLNKFQCSTTDSEILKSLVIVDTPGILSGEKQRVDRGYRFTAYYGTGWTRLLSLSMSKI